MGGCSIDFVLQCVFGLYTLVVAFLVFGLYFWFQIDLEILFFIAQLKIYKCYFATSAEHLILRAFVICIGEHLTTINNMNQLRDIRPIIVHLVPERAQYTTRQLVS